MLGNDEPMVSVSGEIIPSNEFYDYDAKYVDGASRSEIPARLIPRLIAEQVTAHGHPRVHSNRLRRYGACGFLRDAPERNRLSQ